MEGDIEEGNKNKDEEEGNYNEAKSSSNLNRCRITFLVNIWLDRRPSNVKEFNELHRPSPSENNTDDKDNSDYPGVFTFKTKIEDLKETRMRMRDDLEKTRLRMRDDLEKTVDS